MLFYVIGIQRLMQQDVIMHTIILISNTMKKRVHEMELNRTSVQMVLAERFPGAFDKRVPDMVQDNRQKLMLRGNEGR